MKSMVILPSWKAGRHLSFQTGQIGHQLPASARSSLYRHLHPGSRPRSPAGRRRLLDTQGSHRQGPRVQTGLRRRLRQCLHVDQGHEDGRGHQGHRSVHPRDRSRPVSLGRRREVPGAVPPHGFRRHLRGREDRARTDRQDWKRARAWRASPASPTAPTMAPSSRTSRGR